MQPLPSHRKAFLVGLETFHGPSEFGIEESLEELGALADTLDIEVVGQTYQRVRKPNPLTFIGKGKLAEVRQWVEDLDATLVIFDDELSPRHQRELERFFGSSVQVVDRTALILDIFARHARTRESSLQVALAQYEYRLPRLTKQWAHLARQTGVSGVGVGLRGPGETQLETDRREIRQRIARMRRELSGIANQRSQQRYQRERSGVPQVALVGYTNAGKSTLLNSMCGPDLYASERLFATLDPTTRRLEIPGREAVLVTDTVGVIHKLPHQLIATFRSTLQEIVEADLLLHVVDISDPGFPGRIAVAERLIQSLSAGKPPARMLVFNKVDAISMTDTQTVLKFVRNGYPDAMPVSALTGDGLAELLERMHAVLSEKRVDLTILVPYGQYDAVAYFYRTASDVTTKYCDEGIELSGSLSTGMLHHFQDFLAE